MKTKGILKFVFFISYIAAFMLPVSCSSDDGDELKPTSKNILGKWICYEQQWFEDGESETIIYEHENCTLTFNEDYSGSLTTYSTDNILEINHSTNFTWYISENYIINDIYGHQAWRIKSLTESKMELISEDDGFVIIARFSREKTQVSSKNEKLTDETLVGRWALVSYFDSYWMDVPISFGINDERLASGDFWYYIDFNSDGTGRKNVSNNIVLGSSSTSFKWTFSRNRIDIDIYGTKDGWTVDSYKDGILKLSNGPESYATFKKGMKK